MDELISQALRKNAQVGLLAEHDVWPRCQFSINAATQCLMQIVSSHADASSAARIRNSITNAIAALNLNAGEVITTEHIRTITARLAGFELEHGMWDIIDRDICHELMERLVSCASEISNHSTTFTLIVIEQLTCHVSIPS